MKRRRPRSAFVLILVLVLILLLLAAWSVAYRQTAALLRIETARTQRAEVSESDVLALTQAILLLQTGTPEAQSTWNSVNSTYTCTTTVETSSGPESFTITYQKLGAGSWNVQAAPGSQGVAMPASFAP
jgi:hypothetical protein